MPMGKQSGVLHSLHSRYQGVVTDDISPKHKVTIFRNSHEKSEMLSPKDWGNDELISLLTETYMSYMVEKCKIAKIVFTAREQQLRESFRTPWHAASSSLPAQACSMACKPPLSGLSAIRRDQA